ncbi:MAG: hypothetical protein KatS3mg105_0962 [Gemmatales bacterium]|nr:MAG: hypothetical protein KatS3mg105_0962 [Gemmatales bacterium]
MFDGEVVVLIGGKPDFAQLMSREHAQSNLRVRSLARKLPATYIVFDLLYLDYVSVMDRPLSERRRLLADTVKRIKQSRCLILSEGIEKHGIAYFDEAVKRGLEGVIAKKLSSRYEPGRRSGAWTKIKRGSELLCAIIGYVPDDQDFKSLILAAEIDGVIRYVGKVGSGLTDAQKKELYEAMRGRMIPKPVVPCRVKGQWIEPGLFCKVGFLEMSPNGELRMPVLKSLRMDRSQRSKSRV